MKGFERLDDSRPDFPSEKDLVTLMCRHVPYIERYWVDDDFRLGHFGTLDVAEFQPEGGPINEMVIRSMTQELTGYAVLLNSPHFDPDLAGASRDVLRDRLNRCIRWVCAHHLTGDRRTAPLQWNGQWGDDWESSLWAAQLAMAAHRAWDALDGDVRDATLRLLAFEADRFVGVDPPDGRWLDTKAEENAWDAFLLAWATCLQPEHPRAEAWLDRGKAFAVNTFTTDRDRVETRLLDGRPLRDQVATQTAHPDLTVENHGSFHPGYLGCGSLLLEGRLAFLLTGRTPPPQYLRNVREAWGILRRFVLVNGFTSYPSGQDWNYHHPNVPIQWAVMAREFGDDLAAHLLREGVRYLDASMCFAGDGRFDGRMPHAAGGRFFQFESGGMGHIASTVMAGLPEPRSVAPAEFRRRQTGCEAYPYVWMQVRRSRAGLFAFSWRSLRHQVMGTVIPAGGESTFGADQDALVGRFSAGGEVLRPRVICHTDHTTTAGFRTTGEIHYGPEGQVRQTIAVAALEDGETVVVIDRATAGPGVDLPVNEALGIYVMNDFMNGNRVAVVHGGGKLAVRGVGGEARLIETGSTWMRVAGCLGVETDGPPLLYEDAAERNTPAKWKSVLQDRVLVKPVRQGETARDLAAVIWMGKGASRRAGSGVRRLESGHPDVRAVGFETRTGRTMVAANLSREDAEAVIAGKRFVIPAMDVVAEKQD